jgi:hypothetical protein
MRIRNDRKFHPFLSPFLLPLDVKMEKKFIVIVVAAVDSF